MKPYLSFSVISWCAWCLVSELVLAETEADRVAAVVRNKFQDPELATFRQGFEVAVREINPRLFELMRRIDAPLDALGDLKGDGEQKPIAEFLHSQIDALLLKPPTLAPNGIVAARIVTFWRRSATCLVYWSRSGGPQDMEKTVWIRRFPEETIDISAPLDGWDKIVGSSRVPIKECQALLPVFKDPMPPTALPAVAQQFTGDTDYIIEMITKSDDGLKYHWAIRSSAYTRDLEFQDFEKVWATIRATIRDAPEAKSEQAGAGQPATRPESDSEVSDKPQPESEERSR